jgi:hypothetical protein
MPYLAAAYLAGREEPVRRFYSVEAGAMWVEVFAGFYDGELTLVVLN